MHRPQSHPNRYSAAPAGTAACGVQGPTLLSRAGLIARVLLAQAIRQQTALNGIHAFTKVQALNSSADAKGKAKCSASNSGPSHNKTARSTNPLSSRTLPGKA